MASDRPARARPAPVASKKSAPKAGASRPTRAKSSRPAQKGPAPKGSASKGPASKASGTRAQPGDRTARAASTPPTSPLQDLAAVAAGAFQSPVHIDPDRLLELQREYGQRLQSLWTQMVNTPAGQAPALGDKRFASSAWQQSVPLAWNAALYLLNADFLQKMADAVDADAKSRDRIRFFTRQWLDMVSPSNFLPTNPEAQQALLDTRGESLRKGIDNMLADLTKGHISITDEAAFEVGRNVGTSKGAVVFRNEVIELIQYSPSTPMVGSRPLLLVPPFINKFYILDLQPDNSFVAHAVSRGHTVFLVSWINAQQQHDRMTWDDYIEQGVIAPIHEVQAISGSDTLNVLGFCVGGTIVATALAALAARGERPVASLTLMTTLLDFEEPGALGVFIDPVQVAWRDQTIGEGGLMTAQDLGTTFSFLRPNDLVWNYVVSNYLKGQAPPAFDLLFWNADGTNLPGPLYCWYLRHMYLNNELKIPDALTCVGESIDLGAIDVPTYIFAAREDHIVPWKASYGSTQVLSNEVRFVLGASGHIAGAINPVSRNKRSFWRNDRLELEADDWLAGAEERPGSWWADWADWLEGFKGRSRKAPVRLGDAEHPPIEPAPGSYVKVRAA